MTKIWKKFYFKNPKKLNVEDSKIMPTKDLELSDDNLPWDLTKKTCNYYILK